MQGPTIALIDLENLDQAAGDIRHGRRKPPRWVGNPHPPFFDLEALAGLIRERFSPVRAIRAFAHLNRFTCYEPVMAQAGIIPVDVPSIWSGKNAADIAMAYHAAELVHAAPEVDTYVIASHDSDFRPVAAALKKAGKRVVGLGLEDGNCCDEWVEACDEFVRVPRPDDWDADIGRCPDDWDDEDDDDEYGGYGSYGPRLRRY